MNIEHYDPQPLIEGRSRLGLSQTETAERLGLKSRKTIQRVEKGENASFKTLSEYARLCEISITDILRETQKNLSKNQT